MIDDILKEYGHRDGGKIKGPGTGTSDSIPAILETPQGPAPAALSDGEFVITAEVVKKLGGGDEAAGFEFLDTFMALVAEMDDKQAGEYAQLVEMVGQEAPAEDEVDAA